MVIDTKEKIRYVDEKIDLIKDKIELRIESLRNELDILLERFKSELTILKNDIVSIKVIFSFFKQVLINE